MSIELDYGWWTIVKIILGSVVGALGFFLLATFAYLGVLFFWNYAMLLCRQAKAKRKRCLKCAKTRKEELACIYAKEAFKCGKCGTGVKVKMVERKETK